MFSDDQLAGKSETTAFVGRLAPPVIPATGTNEKLDLSILQTI